MKTTGDNVENRGKKRWSFQLRWFRIKGPRYAFLSLTLILFGLQWKSNYCCSTTTGFWSLLCTCVRRPLFLWWRLHCWFSSSLQYWNRNYHLHTCSLLLQGSDVYLKDTEFNPYAKHDNMNWHECSLPSPLPSKPLSPVLICLLKWPAHLFQLTDREQHLTAAKLAFFLPPSPS